MPKSKRSRSPATKAASSPRITAAAIALVADVDKVKTRAVKLAKRLDVPVPNLASDTPSSASPTSAIAGASSSVGAILELLNHIDQAV